MALSLEPPVVDDMTAEDIPFVASIDQRCYPMPWQTSTYATELSNPCATYLVARVGGRIVGYAGMWVIMDEAHITTLAVDPEHRGRGHAARLLLALIDRAIQSGAGRSTLEVRQGNRVARHLYRKFGFADTAVRKCYYTDNQENAIVMWAEGLRTPEFAARLDEIRRSLGRDERSGAGD